MASFFSSLAIAYVDHLAVTTPTLELALDDYLSLPGTRLLRGPGINEAQRVRYAFVRLAEGTTVEILAPLADSPIAAHLQRGGGAYHFCFAVDDLAESTRQALAHGARPLVAAKPDPAFDGRRVAFFHHPAHGLFELVETRPTSAASAETPAADTPSPVPTRAVTAGPAVPDATSDAAARLRRVFVLVFPDLPEAEISAASYGLTSGWDSLTHLQLISQTEVEFGLAVPADAMGTLTSFASLLAFVTQ